MAATTASKSARPGKLEDACAQAKDHFIILSIVGVWRYTTWRSSAERDGRAAADRRVKFLRFRTGCHALPNVTRGWEGVPRSQRLCPLCQSQYCDERHALLECPALVSLREKYHQLFCVHNSMRQFLWQNNMLLLVRYVIKCLDSFAATQ